MKKIAIRVQNINKSYGQLKAVDDLSFDVRESSCFGMLGPNGAGKSTTMKMIYGKGLRNNDQHSVINVFGHDPAKDELSIKALSGIVPQDDNLDEELNVYTNLFIYSKLHGIPKKEATKRIEKLLEFMELSEKRKAKISTLSGGMKRRLIIVRALLNNPKLLILDEPTTGLDPQVRHLIWDKLRQLKEEGVTILLTTHYMEEAFQICDYIMIMFQGRKMLEGNPVQLLALHIEKYVLEIIDASAQEILKGKLNNDSFRLDKSHRVILVYCEKMEELTALINGIPSGGYYLRQSNLEDLFLKTTGRQLNEQQ